MTKNRNNSITMIGNLLTELSSGNYSLSGNPSYTEEDLESIIIDISEQKFQRYNSVFNKLDEASISIGVLKSVFRSVVDMLLILKPDFTIYKTNYKLNELMGYEHEELIDKSFRMLLPKKDIQFLEKVKAYLDEQGFINDMEYMFVAKDGKEFPVLSSISYLYDNNGRVEGILFFLKDISKLKKVENQLKLKNEELNTFVYKASHDLRGPIASIKGLVNLAVAETDDPKQTKKCLGLIEKSINRLDETLLELLECTKIMQGKIVFSLIDFESIIHNILNDLIPLTPKEDIKFRLNILQENKEFINDEKILQSILQNLIQNAIKYRRNDMDHCFIAININILNGEAIIEIEDNGVGMPDNIAENIFKMFYRGNDDSDGSGLGLYIVKKGIEKINGKITVKSFPNKGSMFTMHIPDLQNKLRAEFKEYVKPVS